MESTVLLGYEVQTFSTVRLYTLVSRSFVNIAHSISISVERSVKG